MQKIILILLIVQLPQNNKLLAQSKYFEQSTGWFTIQNGQKIFETSTNNYLIIGDVKVNNTYWWNSYALPITQYGQLPNQPQYFESPINYGSAFFDGLKTEYGFIASGYMVGPDVTDSRIFLLRLEDDGSLVDTIWLENELITESRCITRTPDGGYLLGGYSRQPTEFSRRPYLVRLNADMEVVWDSTYIIPTVGFGLGYFTELIADTTDNSYYALADVSSDPTDLVWLHIDDTGTILDHRVFPSTPYDWPTNTAAISISGQDMTRAKDGDFMISITEIQLNDPIGCYLLKLSPDGDTVRWIGDVDSSGYMNKIHQLADSSFILGGDVYRLQNDNLSLQGAVAHVSKDGDVLWKRIYGGTENDYIYDFTPTSDGGYFCTGRTESNLPNGGANVYLLKTNCMGLLTEPQAAFSATMDTAALTASFQNLSEFVYPDSIDGGHFIWEFGDGMFSSEISPTHTYAQEGVYLVKLTAVVCSDTSSYISTISTWAIGVPSAPSPYYSKVYPNPASNSLYVDHNIPSDKTAFFMLYDLYGKKLNSLPLIGKGQLALPLEDLPNGIYFAQIVMDNNIVVTEKVVIAK
jgi:hypothetical protein